MSQTKEVRLVFPTWWICYNSCFFVRLTCSDRMSSGFEFLFLDTLHGLLHLLQIEMAFQGHLLQRDAALRGHLLQRAPQGLHVQGVQRGVAFQGLHLLGGVVDRGQGLGIEVDPGAKMIEIQGIIFM